MSQKQKIAVEEKVRIVRECLGQKVSISEAAREVGADFETVKMWVSIYENEGVAGFAHHGMKTYTAEMKVAAVKEYLQGGKSVQSIHLFFIVLFSDGQHAIVFATFLNCACSSALFTA